MERHVAVVRDLIGPDDRRSDRVETARGGVRVFDGRGVKRVRCVDRFFDANPRSHAGKISRVGVREGFPGSVGAAHGRRVAVEAGLGLESHHARRGVEPHFAGIELAVLIHVATQVTRNKVVRSRRSATVIDQRNAADCAAIGAVVEDLISPDDIRADWHEPWIERIIRIFNRSRI